MSKSPRSLSKTLFVVGQTCLVGLCVGCQDDLQIRKYTVAKQDTQRGTTSSMASVTGQRPGVAQEQQMLGAIVPHSQSAWFFKLQGDPPTILKNRDEFRQILDSVKFRPTGEPSWELVDGWEDQVLGGGITYAKLTKREDGLTATVTMLATASTKDAEEWRSYVLGNVNRWRGQLDLTEESWDNTEPELEEVEELSEGPAKAYFVSLVGKSSGDSFRPPFMRSAMSGGEPSPAQPSGSANPNAGAEAARQEPALTFNVPEAWTETDVSSSQMRLAAFQIQADDAQAEVTVIAAGGEIQANMKMWFGQIGLDPTQAAVEESIQTANELDVNGTATKVYLLDGAAGSAGESILIADVPWQANQSLFVKLKGDTRLVMEQKESFMEFLESLKW